MGAPVGDWHETSTQVDLLFPRVEQADGSARAGLTITDFAVNLWDQADNNDYTKAAGAGAPGAPTIVVTVNEVASGLYEWSFTPDAAGQFKLLVEYPTDGYVAQAGVGVTAVPGYLDKLNVSGTLAHSDAAATYKADVSALATAAALAVVDGIVDTIVARLTAARAGYLDNLSAGAVALEATITAIKGGGWTTETLKAIKDAVDALGGGGSGDNTVTITVQDGASAPVSGVAVYMSADGGTTWTYSVTTVSTGKAVFHLDDATYKAKCVKSGYTHTAEDVVVSGTTAQTLSIAAFSPGAPAASYCRVYGYLLEVEEAAAIQNQRIVAKLLDKPSADAAGAFYDSQNSQATPDSDGLWYLDLIRGVNMGSPNVHIQSVWANSGVPTGAIDKTVVVPDSASATLASIDAAAID